MASPHPVLVLLKNILEDLKNAKYNDLDDMVYRMQLTYDEIIGTLDIKHIAGSTNA